MPPITIVLHQLLSHFEKLLKYRHPAVGQLIASDNSG